MQWYLSNMSPCKRNCITLCRRDNLLKTAICRNTCIQCLTVWIASGEIPIKDKSSDKEGQLLGITRWVCDCLCLNYRTVKKGQDHFFRQDKGTKLVRRLVEYLLLLETTSIEFHCRRLSLVHVFWDHSLPLNSYSRPWWFYM